MTDGRECMGTFISEGPSVTISEDGQKERRWRSRGDADGRGEGYGKSEWGEVGQEAGQSRSVQSGGEQGAGWGTVLPERGAQDFKAQSNFWAT